MKTQVFESKEECVVHYLKLQGKRADFTAEAMRDFLKSTVSKETADDKLPKDNLLLPTFVIIKRVETWSTIPEVYVELFFPEYAALPYMWNLHILTFKEQEDGTYVGEVPDFKILD